MKKSVGAFVCILALTAACTSASGPPALVPTLALAAGTGTSVQSQVPTASRTPTTRAPTVLPTSRPAPLQVEWRGDLHVHTTSSDGEDTYQDMLQRALDLGFDFLAITDHYGVSDPTHAAASIQCRAETRLFCIPGEELFAGPQPHHLLALGVTQAISADLTLQEQVNEIHRQGGLAIAAHPDRTGYSIGELYETGFDAMECARGSEEYNREQLLLSDQYDLPCAYNSDAHEQGELGSRFTVCSVPINSLVDLKVAWILGQCRMNNEPSVE